MVETLMQVQNKTIVRLFEVKCCDDECPSAQILSYEHTSKGLSFNQGYTPQVMKLCRFISEPACSALINGFALSSVVRACLVLAPAATPFMHAILCCSTRLP